MVGFLWARRGHLGLTQRQVADAAGPGLTVSLICGYETGHHKPTLPKIQAWAAALGCELSVAVRTEAGGVGDA